MRVLRGSVTICSVTMSSATDDRTPTGLGDLEQEVMDLVWRHGEITADQVRERLGRDLKDSTVRTVLRRLEDKGYVLHGVCNRTYVYRPSERPQLVAARAVKGILDRFCEGSMEALLVGMIDAEVLDRQELQDLAKKIAAAKREKKGTK